MREGRRTRPTRIQRRSGAVARTEEELLVTVAAQRWLRDAHFEQEEQRERVLEEAKRQAVEVGYSIVTKGDLQRVMRQTGGGAR